MFEKNSKNLDPQIAQTLFFQMRYDSMPNSEKWPSDIQKGSGTSCFHTTLVLLFCFLFLPELCWGKPGNSHYNICVT